VRAKDIMTRRVVTVTADSDVGDTIRLMLKHRISGAPVVNESGKLIGIVTEGDLMRRAELRIVPESDSNLAAEKQAQAYVKAHGRKVVDIMTKNVVSVDENEAPEKIASVLEGQGIKRVPVVHDGRVIGIVSRANLLRVLAAGRTGAGNVNDSQIKSSILTKAKDEAAVQLALVDVMVSDGIVHLWGNVASEAEREAVRVVAEATEGVKEVQNHLRILPPTEIEYKFE
jgi:CBS-domain-containing membrane protein